MRVNSETRGPGTVVRRYTYQGRLCYLVRFDNGMVVDVYAASVTVAALP